MGQLFQHVAKLGRLEDDIWVGAAFPQRPDIVEQLIHSLPYNIY